MAVKETPVKSTTEFYASKNEGVPKEITAVTKDKCVQVLLESWLGKSANA